MSEYDISVGQSISFSTGYILWSPLFTETGDRFMSMYRSSFPCMTGNPAGIAGLLNLLKAEATKK